MKKRTIIISILVLAFLGWIAWKVVAKMTASAGNGKPGASGTKAISVLGTVVKEQDISEKLLSSGSVLAFQNVILKPEVSGRVVQLNIKEGAIVQQGTLLMKIFDNDLQAQLRKLEIQRELASKNEARLKELLKTNAVSSQDYDAALNQLHTIEADMDLVKAQIAKTEIRAPFTGKLGLRRISQGAIVSPADEITTLTQVSPLVVEFSIPERYYPALTRTKNIKFTTELSKDTLTAPVYALESQVDEATRSLRVRALYPNKNNTLYPGVFAKVWVNLPHSGPSLMVPTNAVIPELKGQKVFVARGGKAAAVKINIGLRTDSAVQVTSGLKPGDTVITTGIMQLRPGMPVTFTNLK